MVVISKLLVVLALAVGTLTAQDAPAVSQHYKPKDVLHYFVKFEGNPELDHVGVQFRLQTPVKKTQESMQQAFDVGQMTKVSPGLYEVNGPIPDAAASGTYRLETAFASHDSQNHAYRFGVDFKNLITIEVVNDRHFDFPDLESIKPAP